VSHCFENSAISRVTEREDSVISAPVVLSHNAAIEFKLPWNVGKLDLGLHRPLAVFRFLSVVCG
jgi:hypothetical protein